MIKSWFNITIVVTGSKHRGSCFLNTAGHNQIGYERIGSCNFHICGKSVTTRWNIAGADLF